MTTKVHSFSLSSSRFASIAWSEMASNPSYSYGLIAGGMNDGYVHVWDPAKLASGEPDQLIASVEQHQGETKIYSYCEFQPSDSKLLTFLPK